VDCVKGVPVTILVWTLGTSCSKFVFLPLHVLVRSVVACCCHSCRQASSPTAHQNSRLEFHLNSPEKDFCCCCCSRCWKLIHSKGKREEVKIEWLSIFLKTKFLFDAQKAIIRRNHINLREKCTAKLCLSIFGHYHPCSVNDQS
jgi:hypothetical protein